MLPNYPPKPNNREVIRDIIISDEKYIEKITGFIYNNEMITKLFDYCSKRKDSFGIELKAGEEPFANLRIKYVGFKNIDIAVHYDVNINGYSYYLYMNILKKEDSDDIFVDISGYFRSCTEEYSIKHIPITFQNRHIIVKRNHEKDKEMLDILIDEISDSFYLLIGDELFDNII